MPRRTKIVATLGPATDPISVMDDIIAAGVDVVRLNLSHDTHDRHRERANRIRERAQAAGREVAVLMDLQGPKIRIGKFARRQDRARPWRCLRHRRRLRHRRGRPDAGRHHLRSSSPTMCGAATPCCSTTAPSSCWVDSVVGGRIDCQVVVGGALSNNKGINKKGGGLSAPALTDKDKDDIRFAAEIDADYLAVSFVRNGDDVRLARELFHEAGGHGGIVAKIERAEALNGIDDIINAADAIMVARGDLGVEIGDAELPAAQKRLISRARDAQQRGHHRHPDDAVHDREPDPDPGRGLRRRQCGARRHRRGHALGGELDRQVPGQGGRGAAPHLPGSRKERHPLGPPDRFGVRPRRRGHRHGRHVHRQSSGGEGDRRADRDRLDGQVDVAHPLRDPDLRHHPVLRRPAAR